MPTPPTNGPYVPWSGDVEPIPFPFRFGLTNRVADLAFDDQNGTLLAATVSGFLHVWSLTDGSVEVLPRGCRDGQVMRNVQAVISMANGFAVCGRFGDGLAVVHYDLSTRTATLHVVISAAGEPASEQCCLPEPGGCRDERQSGFRAAREERL